jgi:hypothetical protein
VIWIKNPDFQIVVNSNFPDQNDRDIINGPYQGYETYAAQGTSMEEELAGLRRIQPALVDKVIEDHSFSGPEKLLESF